MTKFIDSSKLDLDELIIRCDCGSELLTFTPDEETGIMFISCIEGTEGFWYKLAKVFGWLFRGKPFYSWEILVDLDRVGEIADWLVKYEQEKKDVQKEATR